jgi:hypothetical protein
MRRLPQNGGALEQHLTGVGQKLSIDQMKGGAFARTIGADQGQHFTGMQIKRHIVDRLVATESFAQVFHL